LNDTDPRPEKRIGVFDHTHRGVIAVVYGLPFGHGKRFDAHSRVLDTIAGGWNLTGIYTRQSGQPFTFMGTSSTTIGDYVYNGQALNFDSRQVNSVAFNVNAFDRTTAGQFAYHIRTFPTTFSSLRGDGVNQWNSSLIKNMEIHEQMKVQLRFECFNVMNHASFAFPNLAPTNSAFGLITAQSNQPRSVQVGARFVF